MFLEASLHAIVLFIHPSLLILLNSQLLFYLLVVISFSLPEVSRRTNKFPPRPSTKPYRNCSLGLRMSGVW